MLIFISVICFLSLAWGILNGVLLIRYEWDEDYSGGGIDTDKMFNVLDMSTKIIKSLVMYFKYNFALCGVVVLIFLFIIMVSIN